LKQPTNVIELNLIKLVTLEIALTVMKSRREQLDAGV
jgi:hypothetical protein